MFFMDEQLARKRLLSLIILSSWLGAGIAELLSIFLERSWEGFEFAGFGRERWRSDLISLHNVSTTKLYRVSGLVSLQFWCGG